MKAYIIPQNRIYTIASEPYLLSASDDVDGIPRLEGNEEADETECY